jgi:hypothetical protein
VNRFGGGTGLVLLLLSLLWPLRLFAQSVSPPIAEYQEKARSSFQLHNASLFPITVVLEVRGFDITEQGEVIDTPLDTSRVQVKLSEMSFRLPARGTRRVFYEAQGDSLPAWFNILSAMTGARTESGLNVRILLPHVVYLNQKQPLRREDVSITRIELDRVAGKARVQLENRGPRLGRVHQLTLSDAGNSAQPAGGFPLLPRKRRWAEVDWREAGAPSRLTVRFARFTIDTLLSPVSLSSAPESTTVVHRP